MIVREYFVRTCHKSHRPHSHLGVEDKAKTKDYWWIKADITGFYRGDLSQVKLILILHYLRACRSHCMPDLVCTRKAGRILHSASQTEPCQPPESWSILECKPCGFSCRVPYIIGPFRFPLGLCSARQPCMIPTKNDFEIHAHSDTAAGLPIPSSPGDQPVFDLITNSLPINPNHSPHLIRRTRHSHWKAESLLVEEESATPRVGLTVNIEHLRKLSAIQLPEKHRFSRTKVLLWLARAGRVQVGRTHSSREIGKDRIGEKTEIVRISSHVRGVAWIPAVGRCCYQESMIPHICDIHPYGCYIYWLVVPGNAFWRECLLVTMY